ncbi:LysR substrate-binding domain-containing protein [Pendulispora albinea]|uniref:LysR substrate-binding domain-containing protein n=1 Tax=Pendulispora albinea TaxID=2741071 RepID=A0ABZ2LT66_9BACT
MSPLDPALLPTFLAVCDAGRISAAAKVVHLSQPAVTAQIRKLEETLGTPLFVRSARGVVPTPAGERLVTYARRVQRTLEEASASIREGEEPLGTLTLTASTTIAAHVLPPVLAKFRATYPSTPLRIEVGNTEEVLVAVKSGRIPLGLVEGHSRAAGVHLEPYVDDALVPVIGRAALFRVRRLRDLADVPILWREPGSGTRAILDRALRAAGIRKRPLPTDLELASTEAILGAVAAGLGVAFVSRWSIQAHLSAGSVQIVPGLDFLVRRTFLWAVPAGGLQGTEARFYAFARSHPPVVA